MAQSDLEAGDVNARRMQQGVKAGKKGYSWYSRLNKTKKILLWLLGLIAILAIALGVGLGVGLKKSPRNGGIKVKVDNPNVGENLQEHMMTATIYEIDSSIDTPDDLKTDAALAEAADLAYSTSQTAEQMEALQSRVALLARAGTTRERILARQFASEKKLGQVEYIFDLGNWSPDFKSVPGKKYGTILQILQYPFSRGSIHVPATASNRPATVDDKPRIDPKYFEGEGGQVDFDVIATAQRFADAIYSTKPLSDIIIARAFPPPSPSTTEAEDFSDFVRDHTITDWHPVGTCAMGGAAGIKNGVVDERLRVYGVKGLRVADASIMPLQVSAHTQATVYAIGEKCASMILEDRSK
ncbi:hypothetical protein B0A49_08631 [Cryomyces minteri]|uniref:Glucose-methanol-choline oxidoreductase C-terminal domain-containing protein n=1 Tax=Cryomyces minteri TaxID=331657 RepID=A0A4U0WXR5_9PEZI|nr:hypothetical protein B0A49_08631 [Cryomyces minteri]